MVIAAWFYTLVRQRICALHNCTAVLIVPWNVLRRDRDYTDLTEKAEEEQAGLDGVTAGVTLMYRFGTFC